MSAFPDQSDLLNSKTSIEYFRTDIGSTIFLSNVLSILLTSLVCITSDCDMLKMFRYVMNFY